MVRATDDSGAVSNVSAEADSLLQLLRLRLAHLRKEKGDADEYTLHCMHDFARRLNARAQYDEAESLYRECWASRKQTLDENHTGTLAALGNLARLVKTQGRLEEALLLQRQAVEGCRSSMGSEHPDTMSCVNNLASLLHSLAADDAGRHQHMIVHLILLLDEGDESNFRLTLKLVLTLWSNHFPSRGGC